MSLLQTLVAFLVAILLLVSLHELGHLLAARWCGIKVLRFSVGFGKPFVKKQWRNIEWCLAPIPLGGYVKMVDTREGNVAEADLPYAFDKQHPLKRIIVVAAGPLVNLVLAVLLYFWLFAADGITQIKPYVGTVHTPSVAAQAGFVSGDRILAVNGTTVTDFNDARTRIILNLDSGKVNVNVQTADGQNAVRVIDAAGSPEAQAIAKRTADLGISPYKNSDAIGRVLPNSPAEKAGLRSGDRIAAIGNTPTPHWRDWQTIIRENAGRRLNVTYARDGKFYRTQILTNAVELPDRSQIIGQIGVMAAPDSAWQAHIIHRYRPSAGEALTAAWDKTASYAVMTVDFFRKLLFGQASLHHISGPVGIAEVAGSSASAGWQAYLEFLAVVSLSLGVMNLLPIPVLDGGHLVYYTAELIRGKPLSEQVQQLGLRIGITLMLTMMLLAFFNDLTRLFG